MSNPQTITEQITKILRDVDCRCSIHGGDNSYAAQAAAVVEKLGLTEEWSDDIGGPEWGRHRRFITPRQFHPGPKYDGGCAMTDADLITEVASALWNELQRQDKDEVLTAVLGDEGIDCEALATVAIAAYLDIQRRLVRAKVEELKKDESHGH